ncbi:MAG: nucleotidyl transferase AbiEii/AbiGii toxin family protein [Candidatus Saganbacteria bacterium]|nr:nucleotidyl transferase AbiEii/AbiGii toxin family protein [Candidatus Saganbacteria bacterium]
MKELLLKQLEKLTSKQAKYNFTREFLQELILQIIDRRGYFKNLAFVGGTALRILSDLPRFSEDLDFSLVKPKGFNFKALLKTIKNELELNGYEVEEAAGKDKTVLSEFIRFRGLLSELGLAAHKNEKLFIKLEIDSNPPRGFETEVVLVNKNFLFKVQSYQPPSLFAAKLHAVLFRKYEKGRDYYDLLWFLTRDIPINYGLLTNAAAQTEKGAVGFDAGKTKEMLLARIAAVNFTSLLNDARPFLENDAEVEYFRREYFSGAVEKYFRVL